MTKNKTEVNKYDFKSPKLLLDEEIPIIDKTISNYIDLVEQTISDINHFQIKVDKGKLEFIKFENLQQQLVVYSSGWIGQGVSKFSRFGCFWNQQTFAALLYSELKGTIECLKNRVLTRKNQITDIELMVMQDLIYRVFIRNFDYSLDRYRTTRVKLQTIDCNFSELENNFNPQELVITFPIQFQWKDEENNELISSAILIFNQQLLREYKWRAI